MPERHYSREELQAILARAIERQAKSAGSDGLSHAQLLETAHEVGLLPAEVAAAVAEVDRGRARDALTAELLQQRRHRLRSHVATYLAVNAGLWGIDWATAAMGVNAQGGWHWVVAAAWGVALLLQVLRGVLADPATLARDAERWEARRQRKLQKQQMKRAIEGAVTDVVTTSTAALTRLLDPNRAPRRSGRRRDRQDDQSP